MRQLPRCNARRILNLGCRHSLCAKWRDICFFYLGLGEHVTPSLIQLYTGFLSGRECSTSSAPSCTPYVTAGVLYIYPTQFRLHLPGRVASAYGRLRRLTLLHDSLTSSYLHSGLNLKSVHSRRMAQLSGTIFHKIFAASQNSPSSRNA